MKCKCQSSCFFTFFGRIFLATIFVVSGIVKIATFGATTAYMAAYGLPLPALGAALVIAVELGAGLMLLIGWKARFAALLLSLFVIAVTLVSHLFWTVVPPEMQIQMYQFLKNIAILGGLFYVIAFGGGRCSVDGCRICKMPKSTD